MATTAITSIDTQIAGLAQSFQTAIKATIKAESAPITRTQALKDTVDVRRGVYTDIKTNFDGLQSALQALISTQGTYGLNLVSKSTVTPGTTGATVLTTTSTESAAAADYDISVTKLAKAQTKATSLSVSGADVALGKSGTFWLGGSGRAAVGAKTTQAVSFVASNSLTAATAITVASDQSELSTGSYTLQTDDSSGTRKFRLVDSSGNAVSIRSQQIGTSFTSDWQSMANGSLDTGRGLNLTLSTSDPSASTSTALTYTANYTFTRSDTVTAGATATVASGQRELGTGTYKLEIDDSNGTRKFRLVNADGNTVSIRNQQAGTSYTSAWQTMTAGSYDTGRGLSLTLSATGSTASTAVGYTAAGTSISISSSNTLRTITAAINAASQPEGRDLKASIVANQLVLTGSQTGENHTMLYTDGAALGFGADLQAAQNAEFTVNGMLVSRMVNTNLSDVMDGATISLASDAEGKSARLSIAASSDKAAGLMSAMVNSFNTTLTHLKDKLASTPTTVGGKTTYTRGPLSGEQVLASLRQNMLGRMSSNYTNSGSFKNLVEIGLSFDKDMKLTLDSTKFSEALKNNRTNVTALLDTGLGAINSLVSNYAGSSGSLTNTLKSIDVQRTNYDNRILRYNEAIAKRKESLYNQYLGYQNQIVEYGYTAQSFGMITGTTGSNVNTTG